MALLEIRDLHVHFGKVRAVDGVDIDVEHGQLVGLIGPNGAGKTTLIDGVSGFVSSAGAITLDGRSIAGLAPHRRARLGLARTFQSRELFNDLSIRENIVVAAERPRWWTWLTDMVLPGDRGVQGVVDEVIELLGLTGIAGSQPAAVPLGAQKLVGVARALAASPRVLLLDEPGAGLDSFESQELGRRLRQVCDSGVAMLLVDHDMGLVFEVCDVVYVVDFGKVIARGTPEEIRHDVRVGAAYLGKVREPEAPTEEPASVPLPEQPVTASLPSPPSTSRGTRPAALLTRQTASERLLELTKVNAGYGGLAVVRDLSLHVNAGEIVALLGPNGAGKTTTLLTISGILPLLGGELEVLGQAPQHRRPWNTARHGVAHVPEDRALFYGLSVAENLRLGARRTRMDMAEVLELFPALQPLLRRRAGLLSGGEQQMLALARGVVSRPRLLMVDEMSLGLAPVIVERLLPVLRRLAEELGLGVLLVEQHVELALEVADRAYVLSHGVIVSEGPAEDLRGDTEVLKSTYMGAVPDAVA